jgi:hypothetical protein
LANLLHGLKRLGVGALVLSWATASLAQATEDPLRAGARDTHPNLAGSGLSDSALGDQAYEREDLKNAIRHYQQARVSDPNDIVVHDRLLAAEREYRAEAGLNRLYTAHFIIAYPPEVSRRDAHRVADRLELVTWAIAGEMAYLPSQPFSVVLYPRRQFHAATFSPPWARALFDGKIRLLIEDNPGLLSEEILRHEYVHAVAHRLSAGRVPAWLSEGLALFFDKGKRSWQRRGGQATQDYLPLTTRHADLTGLSAADGRAAYRHSYDITRALLAHYGLVRVRLLLERLSQTSHFPSAFEAVMGERFVEFQRHTLAEQDRKGF